MFGRKGDLAKLQDRAKSKGVTFLAARPQQGKTRLLEELLDSFRYPPPDTPVTALVGFAQSTRQEPDLLLRALEDLYIHWLANATFVAQARKLWMSRESSLVEMLGRATANCLSPIFKTTDPTAHDQVAPDPEMVCARHFAVTQTSGDHLNRLSYGVQLETAFLD